MRLFSALYRRTMALAAHRHAPWCLGGLSFAESSFFPIPPDVMLVPMVLARPDRAWLIAGVCTAASVAGGVAGYGIGALLYEEIGRPVLELYGKAGKFEEFTAWFNEVGTEAVLIAAITSNFSAWPCIASATSLPDSVAIATPWPE